MDLELNYEQRALKQMIRDFAEKEIEPVAAEYDEKEEFPYPIVKKMGELGLMGLVFSQEYGGGGLDALSYVVVVEELARVDVSVAVILLVNIMGGTVVNFFGTAEQKQKWLSLITHGTRLAAFGLTEPGAGSDAGATATIATLNGGEWVINGSKCFISNAGTDISGYVTIAAVTGQHSGKREISNILVPKGTPGYIQGKPYRKIGWHATDTRELSFINCRVPEENLIGTRGKGLRQFFTVLDSGRVAVATVGVGLGQRCLELSLSYAQQRVQFGQPISKHQAIQFKLVDMAVNVELARMMVYKAAYLQSQGRPFIKEASMAKLFASEIAVRNAEQGVQIHGGYGYINEYPIARFYRDSKVLTIGDGTSEIQRMIIARQLGC